MARLGRIVLGVVISLAVHAQPIYSVLWDRSEGDARYGCIPQSAALDGEQDLWVICQGQDLAKRAPSTRLYRIDGKSGDLKVAAELSLPISVQGGWWDKLQLIGAANEMFVLSNLAVGGGHAGGTFEGVFLTHVGRSGEQGATLRLTAREILLLEAAPTGHEDFLLTVGQLAVSIRKITPTGATVWTRTLEPKLVAPALAVFPDGSSCLTAQPLNGNKAHKTLQLIRLDPAGRISNQISIAAAQGVVAAGPEQTCALLYSESFRRDSKVRIASYDEKLRRRWDAPTPLIAPGGRDYTLAVLSDGYVATGIERIDRLVERLVMVKLSLAGGVTWIAPLPSLARLVAGTDGVFVIALRGEDHKGSFRLQKIHLN